MFFIGFGLEVKKLKTPELENLAQKKMPEIQV
jgi:hypothetical protein